jgi:putative redox protein
MSDQNAAPGQDNRVPEGENETVIVRDLGRAWQQEISAGRHCFISDEPVSMGGSDAGPSPYQFLLAALGSCTSMTLRMYAERKQWPLQNVVIALTHSKVQTADPGVKTDRIERRITLVGPLSVEQRSRLIEIANKCPVHRTLLGQIDIETVEG